MQGIEAFHENASTTHATNLLFPSNCIFIQILNIYSDKSLIIRPKNAVKCLQNYTDLQHAEGDTSDQKL